MIPIYLTFEGLYSYQARQEIDFENLTPAGLFGVFGAVGSGKSSILEAIVFALYGETERMHSRENRSYNMMNLKVDRSYIAFDFINYENKKFRVTREFKRNSKNFEDIRNVGAVFYEEKAGEWMPLEHVNAEMLTGFSYQNFKRTTIIPQGKFKEFLELGAADRTQMMKEIFSLQQYDLQYKTAELVRENQSQLDHLEGKLSGFEAVSEEVLTEKKELLQVESESFEKLDKHHRELSAHYQLFLNARKEQQLLETERKTFSAKQMEEKKWTLLDQEIQQYELYQQNFANLLREQQMVVKEKEVLTALFEKNKAEKSQLALELDVLKKTQSELKPAFDDLDQRKQRVEDLAILMELKTIEKETKALQPRMDKGKLLIEQHQNQLKDAQDKMLLVQAGINALKEKIIGSQQLVELSHWFQKNQALQQNLDDLTQSLAAHQLKIDAFYKEFEVLEIDAVSFLAVYETKLLECEQQLSQLKKAQEQLMLEQKLSEFSHALHDGEACPMCGALEHPNVLSAKDVSQEIAEIYQKIREVEAKIKQLHQKKADFERLTDGLKIYLEQLNQEKMRKATIENEKKEWQKAFVWKDFSADDFGAFEQKLKENNELEKTLQTQEKEAKGIQVAQENLLNEIKKFEGLLQDLVQQEIGFQERLKTNQTHLKQLKVHDFSETTVEELDAEKNKLHQENQDIEREFKANEQLLNDGLLRWTALEASVKAQDEQLKVQRNKLDTIDSSLKQQLKKQGLDTLEVVVEILKKEYDVPKIRQEIQQFQLAFHALKESIAKREIELKDWDVSEEAAEKRKTAFDVSAQALKTSTEKVAALKSELQRLEKQFEEKKESLKQLLVLEKRADNLKVMAQLFKGSGFVQYVSSVYLAELCEQANERFYRMTRNQLRLQLNEKHDFEVVDYLNEGRTRSVKTLSGGQSFQVALSLALALAESVKTHHRSEKNFFFIDEGFGTQDADSINIVFETLQQLQKENRIVGVISHVTELQERIPMSLRVVNDPNTGSRIERSWE